MYFVHRGFTHKNNLHAFTNATTEMIKKIENGWKVYLSVKTGVGLFEDIYIGLFEWLFVE